MKHLLVDALSVNNLSGRHVLMGHLRELHAARSGRWRFTCLTHRDNASLASDLPQGVTHVQAGIGGAWWQRAAWGRLQFDRLARRNGVDLVLSPAGMLSPGCSLPQIVLAQNPWPLMPAATGLRLRLQKREFARAQQLAWRMTFNSAYMQTLYAEQLGLPTRPSVVVLQGVDEDLFTMRGAGDLSGRSSEILAVSVMAAHKGIEILVDAFANLARTRPLAKLRLIGGWPDGDYRALVDAAAMRSALRDAFLKLSPRHLLKSPVMAIVMARPPSMVPMLWPVSCSSCWQKLRLSSVRCATPRSNGWPRPSPAPGPAARSGNRLRRPSVPPCWIAPPT